MLRSMYSGVSGMKSHQIKMDVIGNNIANVNTFGFKSSRTTFSEVFYQTIRSASNATANQGGRNATQIGYGVGVASVDVQHTRSGFKMTDNGMDLAIAGEGFFQVQDASGNLFFTRAGMIRIDSAGNLVDQNGNFVLGVTGDPLGNNASSEKIRFSIPSLTPVNASITEHISNKAFTITASNPTRDGNVSFNFSSVRDLPLGQKAVARMASNGIAITFNENETFNSLAEINEAINLAVVEANAGNAHPAGNFTIELASGSPIIWPINGREIVNTNFTPNLGTVALDQRMQDLGFSFSSASNQFSGMGDVAMNVTHQATPASFLVSLVINGQTYSGSIPASATTPGKIKLGSNEDFNEDFIVLDHPGFTSLQNQHNQSDLADDASFFPSALTVTGGSVASSESKSLGFGSKTFTLSGGVAGGEQSVSDLINIGIGGDGVISGIHSQLGLIALGRIDIATFKNPQGLTQVGNSYFSVSANSGEPQVSQAGFNGAGGLQVGALEMSNVDLSREFADMITTQRGFQASSRLITVSDEILNELVNLKR